MTPEKLDNQSDDLSIASDTAGAYTALAELPDNALLDEKGMAAAFRVTGRTIRRMVDRHELPPAIPFAGRACWLAGRVCAWINEAAERQEKPAKQHLEKVLRLS